MTVREMFAKASGVGILPEGWDMECSIDGSAIWAKDGSDVLFICFDKVIEVGESELLYHLIRVCSDYGWSVILKNRFWTIEGCHKALSYGDGHGAIGLLEACVGMPFGENDSD